MRSLAVSMILAHLLLGSLARANELSQTYTTTLNLEDLSGGKLSGRYLITIDSKLVAPTKIETFEADTGDADLGIIAKATRINLKGGPLQRVVTRIQKIDENGAILRDFPDRKTDWESFVVVPPKDPSEWRGVGGYVATFSAAPILDDKNLQVPALLSITGWSRNDVSLRPLAEGAYEFVGYRPSSPDTLRYSGTIVAKAGTFNFRGMLSEGVHELSSQICMKAGARRALRPFIVAGGTVSRIELCYPSKNDPRGFVRIVLPLDKPALNPPSRELVDKMLKGWTGRNGNVATKPLLPLASEKLGSYNCHGYALWATLGQKLGLPKEATWIEGVEAYESEGTRPLQTILAEKFELVGQAPVGWNTPAEIPASAREGDLVAFADGTGWVHSGILVRVQGESELWVQSKFEEGGVVETPVANVGQVYNYSTIEIYRPKPH